MRTKVRFVKPSRFRGFGAYSEDVKKLPVAGRPEPDRLERADAARNRTRILAATRKLVAKRPIGDICMDEVARAAGVGKGTLYRRFADRSALCLALLDENERALQDKVLRGFDLPPGTSACERLVALLVALLAFTLDNAQILAEAEAFQRGEGARLASPPYAWRRRVIARSIDRARSEAGLPVETTGLVAELVLAGLTAELAVFHLARGDAREELVAAYLAAWSRLVGLPLAPA